MEKTRVNVVKLQSFSCRFLEEVSFDAAAGMINSEVGTKPELTKAIIEQQLGGFGKQLEVVDVTKENLQM